MEVRVYSPSEVNRLARATLEGRFPEVWVQGEVSGAKLHSSGHLYLTLTDNEAVLEAVQFRGLQPIRYVPKVGEQVLAFGTLTVYVRDGKYELRVRILRPAGAGELHLELEALKAKLEAEGLFAPERKRPLPRYPRRIGVITSAQGAAIRDIFSVIAQRWPLAEIFLFPVRVQGEGAEQEVAQAITDAHRGGFDLDVLIVGRGGGAQEDLQAFNTEAVARAIFASSVPVVSAVGHEVDWTIADLVADVRASTPSAAAALTVPAAADVIGDVEKKIERMQTALTAPLLTATENLRRLLLRRPFHDPYSLISERAERLAQALGRRPFRRPEELLSRYVTRLGAVLSRRPFRSPLALTEEAEERLDRVVERLPLALRPRLLSAQAQADQLIARLKGASPLAILARGYSLTFGPDGQPLRQAADAAVGDLVETILAQGRLKSRVEEVMDDDRGEVEPA